MYRFLLFITLSPIFIFGQVTLPLSKAEQVKVYTQVIDEYIKVVSKIDNLKFDTLYIGNHEEFPKIKLSDIIQNKKIILLTYNKSDAKPQSSKTFIFINIIEQKYTKERAEFMIVTFHQGYHPQHNCYIDFKYNPIKKEFELDGKIRFDYSYSKKQ